MALVVNNWSSTEPVFSSTNDIIPLSTPVPTGTDIIPSQTSPGNPSDTTSLPTSVYSSSVPSYSLNGQSLTNSYTTFTTSYPVVISQFSTTFTSYVTSIVTTSTAVAVARTPPPQSNLGMDSVCIGHGIDSVSVGLLAVAILSALVGFIIWVRTATNLRRVFTVADFSVPTIASICYHSTKISADLRP